jgi:hypothetical protein
MREVRAGCGAAGGISQPILSAEDVPHTELHSARAIRHGGVGRATTESPTEPPDLRLQRSACRARLSGARRGVQSQPSCVLRCMRGGHPRGLTDHAILAATPIAGRAPGRPAVGVFQARGASLGYRRPIAVPGPSPDPPQLLVAFAGPARGRRGRGGGIYPDHRAKREAPTEAARGGGPRGGVSRVRIFPDWPRGGWTMPGVRRLDRARWGSPAVAPGWVPRSASGLMALS